MKSKRSTPKLVTAIYSKTLRRAIRFGAPNTVYTRRPDVHPVCTVGMCADGKPMQATFLAAQSTSGGYAITWVPICDVHADGWFDESDWLGPIYRLVPMPMADVAPTTRQARPPRTRRRAG